jgi:transposase
MQSAPKSENKIPETLRPLFDSQQRTILSQSERIDELEQQLAWLKRHVFGRKTERVILPGQGELFETEVQADSPDVEPATQSITYERNKPVRQALPANLPRERIELDVEPQARHCPCCGGERHRFGEDVTEELHCQPARLWVREYVRAKYACKTCEEGGVAIAKAPVRLIPKSLFGPSVQAKLLIGKYEDHLPLHRQLKIFRREGVSLGESTVNDTVLRVSKALDGLMDGLRAHVFKAERIFTDDTPIVLKGNHPDSRETARLWVYVRQGEDEPPATVFDFTTDRTREGPADWLRDYQGYLQADGYPGYDRLYASGHITEVACWDHARRYFEKAAKLHKKSGRAHQALAYIQKLYIAERELKELSQSQRFFARREVSLPVLRDFRQWLERQHDAVSVKSAFGAAVTYTLNQWQALVEYTNHGLLNISNATAENAIRPVAVGRKNWLHLGSKRGGHTAATMFSLMATCKQNQVNPWSWLTHVLTVLPTTPKDKHLSLLPFHFREQFPL